QLGTERGAEAEIDDEGGVEPSGDGAPSEPRRFYGRVTLEPIRLSRDVDQISEALIAHLNRPAGSSVKVTVEIEAESAEGFPEDLRRTVSENARTLKFESSEFES